ncbi:unnamed protein product [Effrenium voratum]|uniref:Uncharacterized protein n=1 Tax=Effrenium voratum TaxID=2562239 RepID=A0AA36N299_9DINO|nr:unnamed protein product [Effrenium voratum]
MAFVHGVQPIGAACHALQLRSRLRFSRRSPRLAAPCAVRGRGRVPRSSRKAPEPALRAEVIFCLLATGSSSRHAWPKTLKAAASLFGNRRDSLARSLLAALQRTSTVAPRTAAALVFDGGRRKRDLTWWVLDPEFLGPEDHTEFRVLRRLRRVADHEQLPGVDFHQQSTGPRGLQEAVLSFLQGLGHGQDSAAVLLDERHSSLPIAGHFISNLLPEARPFPARRAVFFLGCPGAVSTDQAAAISWAAEHANWQLLRFSLGWVSEFTSKIVSRLKIWHAAGKLLPMLGGLLCRERGTARWQLQGSSFAQDEEERFSWPAPKQVQRFEPGLGPRLHFLVHVSLDVMNLKAIDSPEHSLLARCCLAALWRAHGAYYRCMVSFVQDGPVVTVSRKFAGRFMGKAPTENEILTELNKAVQDAAQRPPDKQRPGKWAVSVQWPKQSSWGESILAYPKDTVLELKVALGSEECQRSLECPALDFADGIDVLVIHLFNENVPLCQQAAQAILLPSLAHASEAEVICILQSALLNWGPAGQALLEQITEKSRQLLNYYELARQFDFEAQAKALAAQAPGAVLAPGAVSDPLKDTAGADAGVCRFVRH